MLVGVPKEVKNHEYRVGLVPASVRELKVHGHDVIVESTAGEGVGFDDDSYRAAGAEIVGGADDVFQRAEMVVKVKEPQPAEYAQLREGQVLFTYLHLAHRTCASDRRTWSKSGCIAIAYETVTNARGGLPLLSPHERSRRAHVGPGRSPLFGEGAGRLPASCSGGVPGVAAARVLIIGGGVSGHQRRAHGHGHGGCTSPSSTSSLRAPLRARYAVRSHAEHDLLDGRFDREPCPSRG